MERAVSMMDRSRGVEKLVHISRCVWHQLCWNLSLLWLVQIILVNYVDYSMRNAPAFKTSKATLDILMVSGLLQPCLHV